MPTVIPKKIINVKQMGFPMLTKNPRINITVKKAAADLLAVIAKREKKSISGIAKELILEALEWRENFVISACRCSRIRKR